MTPLRPSPSNIRALFGEPLPNPDFNSSTNRFVLIDEDASQTSKMSTIIFAGRSQIHQLRHTLTVQRNQLLRTTKRPSSSPSKPPTSSPSPTTPPKNAIPQQQKRTMIPGPAWAWIEPLATPFYAYGRMQARSPLLTQLLSSLTIYFIGDLSAQLVATSGNEDASDAHVYEPIRGIRALIIGGLFSIPSYKWFMFLGNHLQTNTYK